MSGGKDDHVELRVGLGPGGVDGATIAAMRRLFPQLRERTVADLMRDLGVRGWVSLGRMGRRDADRVVEEAREVGVLVEISTVKEP